MKRATLVYFIAAVTAIVLLASPVQAQQLPTLNVLWWPGPEGDAMQEVCNYWNEHYAEAEGFTAQVLLTSRVGWWERMMAALSAGSREFDVVMTATYELANMADHLVPVTDQIDTWNLFIESSLDAVRSGGKTYAVPTDITIYVPMYRTDLIERLLTDPEWQQTYTEIASQYLGKPLEPKQPEDWDWDDLKAVSLFFTRSINRDSPVPYGIALPAKNIIYNVFVWNGILWSMGGNWFDASGNPALDSPEALEAMAVYTDLMEWNASPDESINWEYPELQLAFGSGQVAIILQAIAGYGELINPEQYPQVYDKVGLMPNPGNHATHTHVLGAAVNKHSRYVDEGVRFLQFLATEPALRIYLEGAGNPPVPNLMEAYAAERPHFPFLSANAVQYGFVEAVQGQPAPVQYFSAVAEELSAGWALVVSPEEALRRANERLSGLLSR